MIQTLNEIQKRLDEANQRPANRAAALALIGASLYLLFLLLPVGSVIGFAWESRLFATFTAVMVYSFLHALYKLEQAGGIDQWESKFND